MTGPSEPATVQDGPAPREEWDHLRRVTLFAGLDDVVPVLPAEGYVTGDHEVALHYLEWPLASPEPPALLFLHGGGLQAHTWDAVCLRLRSRFRSFALDLRGHGDSDWALDRDYGLEALADDVSRMIRTMDARRVILVGHSLGGMAALVCAARGADPIDGLVLVDVGPQLQSQGTERIRDFITARREFDSLEDLLEYALAFAPGRRRELLVNSLRHNIRRLPNGRYTWKYDLAPFGPVQPAREDVLWQAAERITCPALVVRGEHSRVFIPDAAERFVTRLRRGTLRTIGQSGHTVQGDNPRALADTIAEFADATSDLELS